MAAYFFDSNAIVKHYVRERGSDWIFSAFLAATFRVFLYPLDLALKFTIEIALKCPILLDAEGFILLLGQTLGNILAEPAGCPRFESLEFF